MKTLIFDIETGPIAQDELLAMMPAFDPAEVRTGNIRDPEKIAAKVEDARANHQRDYIDRAALDAITGRVIAIGVLSFDVRGESGPEWSKGALTIIGRDNEADTLREFWAMTYGEHGRQCPLVGFNCNSFDLPFLFKRSWKYGVMVPTGLRRGRFWSEQVLDLRDVWQLGDRMAKGSLDAIARHLGCGQKNGDGKDFARLWQSDRAKAIEYLTNDLRMTAAIAGRLGVHI